MSYHFTEWITFCLLILVLKKELIMNLNKEKIKENWPEINRRFKSKVSQSGRPGPDLQRGLGC
jgi:hypothetical protein